MILNYFPDRVLIVGGTGFTGERVALRLRKLGVLVRVLTRNPESSIARRLKGHGCEIFEGDCTRRWTLWEATEECDVIVNCAHIKYAEVLVQACMRCGIDRLVSMSSTRRYSKIEDPTIGQVISGEAAILDSNLDWTILRSTMIFGGQRDRNISRLVNWTRRHSFIPIFGKGEMKIQPTFVEDLVTAIVETLRRPATVHRDYTLSGASAMSYNELLHEIFRACNREIRIVHVPLSLGILAVRLMGPLFRRYGLSENALLRFQEDKSFDHNDARNELDYAPTPFLEAAGMMVARTCEVDVLYVPVS